MFGVGTVPVTEFLLYQATIPATLLRYLDHPTAVLPPYDPIEVECISISGEPLETLRDRIIALMPDVFKNEDIDISGNSATDQAMNCVLLFIF